jgi:pimeloyl-ACP methyl ester carboxylesterase
VLFAGGIGCYSIDNTFDDLDAYRALATDLTRARIVTMRVEKSGVGDSQGRPCATVDFDTEIAGYKAGLAALLADPRVDPHRVFVFGHSVGGIIAPILAESFPVAGIIVADTGAIDWFGYEMINERRQAALAGMNPGDVDADAMRKEECMHAVLIDGRSSSDVIATDRRCSDFLPYPASDAYMRQVARTNIGQLWATIRVPVLAIYGTSDFITAEADHRRIVGIVEGRAGSGSARFVAIDQMDHYLTASASQQTSFNRATSGHAEGPFDHALSRVIVEWLRAHFA